MAKYLFEEEDKVGPNDLSDVRVFHLKDGKTAVGHRQGQYGFWKFKYDQGLVPDRLSGEYTTFSSLEKDVRLYFQMKNNEVIDVQNKDVA